MATAVGEVAVGAVGAVGAVRAVGAVGAVEPEVGRASAVCVVMGAIRKLFPELPFPAVATTLPSMEARFCRP